MEPFFAQYRSVLPYLSPTDEPGYRERTPVGRGPRALRRHHQVHPLRRLHDVVPVVLGAAELRRPGRHRQRPPLHLRQPRRGRRRAPRDPQRAQRRVALPHGLQLHRRLPPRHQGHPGHRGGQAGDPLLPRLTAGRSGGEADGEGGDPHQGAEEHHAADAEHDAAEPRRCPASCSCRRRRGPRRRARRPARSWLARWMFSPHFGRRRLAPPHRGPSACSVAASRYSGMANGVGGASGLSSGIGGQPGVEGGLELVSEPVG